MSSESMVSIKEGSMLRIFVGERDKHQGVPLYEWLVKQAQQAELSGATVFRGILGFGAHTKVHSAKLLDLSVDLPLVIEIIDEKEKIERFMSVVDDAVGEGLATVENVQMRVYRKR